VAVPGQQSDDTIPLHIFLARGKSEVVYSFQKGDLLFIRGATSVGEYRQIAFFATEVRAAKQ
jgi:hypothetical protein